jgi:hypothetical protein
MDQIVSVHSFAVLEHRSRLELTTWSSTVCCADVAMQHKSACAFSRIPNAQLQPSVLLHECGTAKVPEPGRELPEKVTPPSHVGGGHPPQVHRSRQDQPQEISDDGN